MAEEIRKVIRKLLTYKYDITTCESEILADLDKLDNMVNDFIKEALSGSMSRITDQKFKELMSLFDRFSSILMEARKKVMSSFCSRVEYRDSIIEASKVFNDIVRAIAVITSTKIEEIEEVKAEAKGKPRR